MTSLALKADEIADEAVDRVLATEFQAVQSPPRKRRESASSMSIGALRIWRAAERRNGFTRRCGI